ncbi:hypothetical protein [Bacillus altitudinis]|uniref:hypothetical protein n=1 Tax=Bacillus altitudinis TaxID=293387 RepID=UPI003F7BAFA5
MKTVNVMYFRTRGKFYIDETIEISESLNGYDALFHEIPKHHRIKEMIMSVSDSGDGKEPFIVPHLFFPKN